MPREGFRNFIGTWIYSRDDAVILVDPGPRSTIPVLLKALEDINIGHIDYILLTHIHLDHAGGLGFLLRHYPEAKAICHRKGISHLVEPAKLWEVSKQVLGDIADLYGELDPVPEGNIEFKSDLWSAGIPVNVYETPGHAVHHLSFKIGDILFVGEALGIHYPLGKDMYLRIASPPGFDIRDYRRSLGVLRNLDIALLCFGHYGISWEREKLFILAAAQAELWSEIISRYSYLESPLFEEKVLAALLPVDPGLSCFHQLPDDIKKRELYFLGNSFKGFKVALNKA